MDAARAYTEPEEQILEAALHVFARKGKDGARMQEIADAAGSNKAMLHYYFRSKDRLYDEVFGFVLRRFLVSFSEAVSDADTFAETLRRFIGAYLDFVGRNGDVVRLFVNENLSGGEAMGRHIRTLMTQSAYTPPRLLAARIERAVARGEIRPVDPFQLMVTAIAGCIAPMVLYPTLRSVDPAAVEDRAAFIEARKTHLFETLYDGLRVRPEAHGEGVPAPQTRERR